MFLAVTGELTTTSDELYCDDPADAEGHAIGITTVTATNGTRPIRDLCRKATTGFETKVESEQMQEGPNFAGQSTAPRIVPNQQ